MNVTSESSSPPGTNRSLPVEHAALFSWLRSGSGSRHQQPVDGAERPVSGMDNHRDESGMTKDGSSTSLHVSKDVQTYFNNLEFRQCRTSSVGPSHTLRVEQRLPVVHVGSDGQDSGVEDLGMASPGGPQGLDAGTKTTLTQKEFMVYRRVLLCAQFPVLSAPQPTSSPHPSSPYPMSPPPGSHPHAGLPHFSYLAFRHPQARLTPDKVSLAGDYGAEGRSDEESEEDVLVQNEMLASVVRKAFQLSEERHRYYDEVITEGLGRKAPARVLIEELVSRLSVVENNKHPFYHPQAFEPRAYDVWQQGERRHIGELIESFWQFSLPSPASSMVKPSFWQSVHEEYHDLMVRLIRLDKRHGVNSYSTSMLTSTSRRLLKEFGLRYGVGELYRRIVFLEYISSNDNFECEVWYMEVILRELNRLLVQLPSTSYQARFTMVRQEYELLQEVLSKLHEHSKQGLQGLLQSHEDLSQKAVALVNLLSSVLNLKTQLTGRKGSTLEHYLEGYIKESAKQAYHRHKLRLGTELQINTYISPVTAELVTKLVGCIDEDVRRCRDIYHSIFFRYKQDIVQLAATSFYSNLMTDVNLVSEMSDIDKELNSIDQDLLALAQKLGELDVAWREFIPRQAQQWRQPMLSRAKAWLKVMTKQLTHLVINVVNTDKFQSEFGKDSSSGQHGAPRAKPRQASILRHSPFSAFKAVSSSVEGSPDRVRGRKGSLDPAGHLYGKQKSRKPTKDTSIKKTEAVDSTHSQGAVLYLNASGDIKRIKSMPDITRHESWDPKLGMRRSATTADFRVDDTHSNQIQFLDASTGIASFLASEPPAHQSQRFRSTSSETEDRSVASEGDIGFVSRDSNVPSQSARLPEAASITASTDEPKVFTVSNNTSVVSAMVHVEDLTAAMDSLNNNGNEECKSDNSPGLVPPGSEITLETNPSLETDPTPPKRIPAHKDITDIMKIEVLTESGSTGVSETDFGRRPQDEQEGSPMAISNGSASDRSSFIMSTSTTARGSHTQSVSVSFQVHPFGARKMDSSRPDGFSTSLVDVMFMTQRIIGFMQKLIGILCPADAEVPLGPDGDFLESLSIRTFWERVKSMKLELKEITEEAIVKVLVLYANNLLAMDLCATEKDQVNSLVDAQVLAGVLVNRQESMLSRCRHEKESGVPCDYFLKRDAALLCDKHEPITPQMCVRINNSWSVICLLPKLASMLQSRLRGRPPSPSSSEDDHSRIRDEPMEHGEIDTSSLAEGDHSEYLHKILQAQIQLLAHKLNMVLREALRVLLCPEFDDLTIVDRLQPLTSCLFDHWEALGQWLTPPCLLLFMERLWLCLMEDFEKEVEGLRSLGEDADSQALLLSQSISHLIEFLHAKGEGLGIDQLVKPAEIVLNKLQMHSLSSKTLIHLYQRQLRREAEAEPGTEPLPRDVLRTMYQALHKQRKCFTGHHMMMWLLVHYYKAQDHPTSKRIKYKRKAQQVGQKLLDMGFIQHVTTRSYPMSDLLHDELAGFSSDASLTDSTPYPTVTIHSVPKTSIHRQSQEIGNDSSEDNLEASAVLQRRRRTKRRISDFYSEEVETSDDSSTSKSEGAVRKTIVLKADVHVSAPADLDDAVGTKEKNTPSTAQEEQGLQDFEGDAGSSDEQSRKQTPPSEAFPKISPSRKTVPRTSSGGDAPPATLSSSSGKRESSSQSTKHVKPSESKHLFFTDSQHFYYFCDIDDQLFYSMSGDLTRSTARDDHRQTYAGPPERHHLHLKHQAANAEFILGILLCRRKRSRVAKNFTRSVPSNFWREESSSPCCNCFR